MPNNFHYAAYSYLDEWMSKDRIFHRVLAYEKRNETLSSSGRESLVEAAKYYGVIRTLRKAPETSRLEKAYAALHDTDQPDEYSVVALVVDFAAVLKGIYGVSPLSAASKFLWMRFRTPVVIYDQLVSSWLTKNLRFNDNDYSTYYRAWSSKYQECEASIRDACSEIKNIKRFTRACDVSDEVLLGWTESRWFRERVFDHYMLTAPNPE